MADSKKGVSSIPATPKDNSQLLGGDIGKEFLSSWKSTEDDAMDFGFEPISKGNKKNTMNFDNIDMDFNLDGDFGKISSFKVDLADLDFSSPPRKSSKPKERSEEKSSTGTRREKEDNFSFSFDFNELDGFDFTPSLKKEETKSTKNLDGKEIAPEKHESQGSEVHLSKGFDAFGDGSAMELPVSETVATQQVKTLTADVGDLNSMKDDCPSKSATFRTSVEANLKQSSLGAIKDSDQEHLLEGMLTKPCTDLIIEDLAIQSAGENDTVPIPVPELQTAGFSTARNDDSCGVQNGHQNMDTTENLNKGNLQCKDLHLNITASEKDNNEISKSSRDATQDNIGRIENSHGDLDVEDASTTIVSRKAVHNPNNRRELQNSDSAFLVPLESEMALDKQRDNDQKTQVHPEPIMDTMAAKTEKEGGVRSKYFKKSDHCPPQKDQASSSEINASSISKNRSDSNNLTSSDEMRVELNSNSARPESKLVTKSQSCHEELKDGHSAILGSSQEFKSSSNAREVFDADGTQSGQKVLANSRLLDNKVTKRTPNLLGNVKSMISSRIHVEASGNTPKSSSQTMMNSKLVLSRTVSAEVNKLSSLKDGLKKPDSSVSKISRTTGANNDVPSVTLQRDTNALRNTANNMEVLRNTVLKTSHSAESIRKQPPQTPTLKRKSFEASNTQKISPSKSLKRFSETPTESRNFEEHPKDALDKLACDHQSRVESEFKINITEHLKSVREVPQKVNMREQEVILNIEDNGNVEKAEAYAKDLENICNIMRKKHEEAKELLVRAVVNNNNLLMLHHPIYEEKIRIVQNFAARLMSKQLQT